MCCVAEHSPVGLVVSVFICVEVYSEAFPASQKLKCCKQTLEPGLKTKQGSVGTVGAGGSWQLLGQLVRSRESPACPLQGSPCLSSCPRPITGCVCLVLHSESAKNLLCVVKQHECALPAPIRECWGQRRPGWCFICCITCQRGRAGQKSQVEVTAFFRLSDAFGNTGVLLPFGKGSRMYHFPPN